MIRSRDIYTWGFSDGDNYHHYWGHEEKIVQLTDSFWLSSIYLCLHALTDEKQSDIAIACH